MQTSINGTLFSLDQRWWHGLEWNKRKKDIILSEDDWKERVQLVHKLGMDTIIIQFAVLAGKSFYPSRIFPPMYNRGYDTIKAILDESAKTGIRVYIPIGSLVASGNSINNITDTDRLTGTERLMKELFRQSFLCRMVYYGGISTGTFRGVPVFKGISGNMPSNHPKSTGHLCTPYSK